jgi:TolB protein
MNADGSGLTQLTNNELRDWEPNWSTDNRIAFERHNSTNPKTWAIIVMNPDGSGIVEIVNDTIKNEDPHWSPDSRRIVFTRYDGSDDEIFIMNDDGSGLTPLTSKEYGDYEPGWSPDGQKIVWQGYDGNDHEIYTINIDGTGMVPLTAFEGFDLHPDWQPIRERSPVSGEIIPINTLQLLIPYLLILAIATGMVLMLYFARIKTSKKLVY